MSKAGQIFKRLTPYNIKKGIRYLKHYGVRGFYARLLERFEEREVEYQEWYEKNKPSEEELARQRKKKWKEPVTISVLVPAYRTPEVFLRQMIESVLNQTYPHLELCIADGSGENISVEKVVKEYQAKDQRVRYQRLEKNEGIAGNTNGWPQAIIWPFSTTTIFWLPTPFLRWLPRLKRTRLMWSTPMRTR